MQYIISRPAAVLLFTGEDHETFLHGQGTADLTGSTGYCRYTLWLDFKGNVLGDSYVMKLTDSESLLVSDYSAADMLVEKFDRHIIADDVTIVDRTNDFRLLSVAPHSVESFIHQYNWPVPEADRFKNPGNGIVFTGKRLGKGSLQVLVPENEAIIVDGECLSVEEAEYMRIREGIAVIPVDTDQNSLNPLEMSILSPISFTKGCYLGQEVVSRAHRLGRVSRRLVRFESKQACIGQGDCLHLDEKEVGKLTSVVKVRDKMCGTGWLKSRVPDGEIRFDEGTLSVLSLPLS